MRKGAEIMPNNYFNLIKHTHEYKLNSVQFVRLSPIADLISNFATRGLWIVFLNMAPCKENMSVRMKQRQVIQFLAAESASDRQLSDNKRCLWREMWRYWDCPNMKPPLINSSC
jgi:hypothetical protein